jgi:hypothetical protein
VVSFLLVRHALLVLLVHHELHETGVRDNLRGVPRVPNGNRAWIDVSGLHRAAPNQSFWSMKALSMHQSDAMRRENEMHVAVVVRSASDEARTKKAVIRMLFDSLKNERCGTQPRSLSASGAKTARSAPAR